jgi:hypothetical protein
MAARYILCLARRAIFRLFVVMGAFGEAGK